MISHRRLTALLCSAAVAATALVCAPAASAAPGDRELVDAWYATFLGREADAGSQYWVDRLATQAPADVLWSITHSTEYHREAIAGDYAFYLSREPDAGAQYWQRGADAQAFPLEWVQQNVASSPEAVAAGNQRDDLVQTWYYGALGAGEPFRLPDPGEVAYWQERVRQVGALGAYRELYYTPEVTTARITNWYSLLLGREPSTAEVAYWYPKEVESDINVGVLIASTPEYRSQTS